MLHTPTAHFIRHYLEMVIAMLLGMAVLGIPGFAALAALGVDTDAAGVLLWGMAVSMTVPMVAWMSAWDRGLFQTRTSSRFPVKWVELKSELLPMVKVADEVTSGPAQAPDPTSAPLR